MDNLYIKEIWNDANMKEWEIIAQNEFVRVTQTVYIQEKTIEEMVNKLKEFLKDKENIYIEIGKKQGNYTPAISIEIHQKNAKGDVCIELDMEIADSQERKHRCSLYIMTDIGAIERLKILLENGAKKIRLYEDETQQYITTNKKEIYDIL